MVGAIRQSLSGIYATVMVPQVSSLFPFSYLSIVFSCFLFHLLFSFGPFCRTQRHNPIIDRNAPAPISKAPAQETEPIYRRSYGTFRVFFFYSSPEAPCESSRGGTGDPGPDPLAWVGGYATLGGVRNPPRSAPPLFGTLWTFGLDPGWNRPRP